MFFCNRKTLTSSSKTGRACDISGDKKPPQPKDYWLNDWNFGLCINNEMYFLVAAWGEMAQGCSAAAQNRGVDCPKPKPSKKFEHLPGADQLVGDTPDKQVSKTKWGQVNFEDFIHG